MQIKRLFILPVIFLICVCDKDLGQKSTSQSGLIESKIAVPGGGANQKLMLLSEINKIDNSLVNSDSTTAVFMKTFDSTVMCLSTRFFVNSDHNQLLQEIKKTIFTKWKIQYCSSEQDYRYCVPGCVLNGKKGSAAGITFLYLLFADRLDLPLHAIKVGSHWFVRYDNGKIKYNIEPSKSGDIFPDSWYIENYAVQISDKHFYIMKNDDVISEYRQIISGTLKK
jgi:hypothetical protein